MAFWKQVKKDLKGTILEVGQGDQVQMQTGALSQGLQQEIGSEEQQCRVPTSPMGLQSYTKADGIGGQLITHWTENILLLKSIL